MEKIKIRISLIVLLLFLAACYACGDNNGTSASSDSEVSSLGQVLVSLDTETNMVTVQIKMTSLLTDGTEVKLHSSYLNSQYGGSNCGDVIAVSTIVDGCAEFTFENQAVTYAVEDGFRDRFWGTIWYTSSETCDSPDEWIDFVSDLAVNPYYIEDCDSSGGIEVISYVDRIETVPADATCGEIYEELVPEPTGQVLVSLDTETNTITLQIEITSSFTDGTEIKLHSSYLNHLNGSENCGDVIATAAVSSGWITFSFENPAVTYAVEDGFRDRFWGTVWYTSSETCDFPDEWIDFVSDLTINPYYFEDCNSSGGIETVFYADKVETVPTDAACGEVYEEL